MTYPGGGKKDKLYKLDTGDLVVYFDKETMPQWADTYGVVVSTHWNGDWRLCSVWWAGESSPTIHYKYELQTIKNEERRHGKYILGRS